MQWTCIPAYLKAHKHRCGAKGQQTTVLYFTVSNTYSFKFKTLRSSWAAHSLTLSNTELYTVLIKLIKFNKKKKITNEQNIY